MGNSRCDFEEAVLRELRAIRLELALARAPRTGPITIEVACGIIHCSDSTLHKLLRDGRVKRWPKKALGKESLLDASSVWRVLEVPASRVRTNRSNGRAVTVAEAIRAIPID